MIASMKLKMKTEKIISATSASKPGNIPLKVSSKILVLSYKLMNIGTNKPTSIV